MAVVRLLGPVDVMCGDGVGYAPGSPTRSTILSLMALAPRQSVSFDRLLDEVWNGQPPSSGRRALRFHVSRLRAEIPISDLIQTVHGGYLLDADVDAAQVDAAVHHIDIHGTLDLDELSGLLDRWRGEPFTGALSCDRLERERDRLALIHLTLIERHFRARLETTDPALLIPELRHLCHSHPLREHLWSTLISAFDRSGQQGEALRAYEDLRVNLRDQLGLEPSPTSKSWRGASSRRIPLMPRPFLRLHARIGSIRCPSSVAKLSCAGSMEHSPNTNSSRSLASAAWARHRWPARSSKADLDETRRCHSSSLPRLVSEAT